MCIDQFLIRLKGVLESEFIQGPKPLLVEICGPLAPAKVGKDRCVRRTESRKKRAEHNERKRNGKQQSCERKAKPEAKHGTLQRPSCRAPSKASLGGAHSKSTMPYPKPALPRDAAKANAACYRAAMGKTCILELLWRELARRCGATL
jgi:hypothetical protein